VKSVVKNGIATRSIFPSRLIFCDKVSEAANKELRQKRNEVDPIDMAEEVERSLSDIFRLVERIDEERRQKMERAGEMGGCEFSAGFGSVAASVDPCAPPPSNPGEKLVKTSPNNHKTTKCWVS
jgi:hypothetical protein